MNAVMERRTTTMSFAQKDAIRQAGATLAIEDMYFPEEYMSDLKDLAMGRISREEYQARIAAM